MEVEVNPEMIRLARAVRSMTQAQLSLASGVSQPKLSRLESSLTRCGPDVLSALVRVLGFPESFFCLRHAVYEAASSILNRKKVATPAKTEIHAEAIANLRRIHVEILLRSVEVEKRSLKSDNDGGVEGARRVAKALRRDLRVPRGPIQNVTDLLEDCGVFVFQEAFTSKAIDGFTLMDGQDRGYVFVNYGLSGDRLRFTLAHELGHIVMHDLPSREAEREADAFAAEFLMPESEIASHLEDLNLQRLGELKRYWRVSMAALIMRAGEIGAIGPERKRRLQIALSAKGYRMSEPIQLEREEPSLMREVIDAHRERLQFSEGDLARLLCIEASDLSLWYPKTQPRFRLMRGGSQNSAVS